MSRTESRRAVRALFLDALEQCQRHMEACPQGREELELIARHIQTVEEELELRFTWADRSNLEHDTSPNMRRPTPSSGNGACRRFDNATLWAAPLNFSPIGRPTQRQPPDSLLWAQFLEFDLCRSAATQHLLGVLDGLLDGADVCLEHALLVQLLGPRQQGFRLFGAAL